LGQGSAIKMVVRTQALSRSQEATIEAVDALFEGGRQVVVRCKVNVESGQDIVVNRRWALVGSLRKFACRHQFLVQIHPNPHLISRESTPKRAITQQILMPEIFHIR
jgi:hypothetical protein